MEILRHLHRQIALVPLQIQFKQLHEADSELEAEQRRQRLILPQMATAHKHVPLSLTSPRDSHQQRDVGLKHDGFRGMDGRYAAARATSLSIGTPHHLLLIEHLTRRSPRDGPR